MSIRARTIKKSNFSTLIETLLFDLHLTNFVTTMLKVSANKVKTGSGDQSDNLNTDCQLKVNRCRTRKNSTIKLAY